MQAITKSGVSVPCANFKAIDTGVVLTEDEKRKHVVGFIPYEDLQFVLPDDVAATLDRPTAAPRPEADEQAATRDADATGGETKDADTTDDGPTASERESTAGEGEDTTDERAAAIGEPSGSDTNDATAGATRRARAISALTQIHGLGPTYATRLYDAGIVSLAALADASPAMVADATNVPEQRAQHWIDRAAAATGQTIEVAHWL
ncbi:helix-hairpin-helix domain-containing protein [Haloarchaeobius sp. DFWS5]|uniref:helix-hairpin-helix domain-containing protein n=1 Tax=Haloarchaeobius sp. DFWS5 TaxID=3446114 RepID=UPI003EBE2635